MSEERKPFVTAEIVARETEIDGKTGDVTKTVVARLGGFGSGLRRHLAGQAAAIAGKVPEIKADITINVGQYPHGHPEAGRWAVQVMVASFEDKETADLVADRLQGPTREALGLPYGTWKNPDAAGR